MENSQGNSFIPKSPVRATTKPRGRRRVFIFTYITFVFFFGTLIAAAGIFIWGVTIEKQLDAHKSELADQRDSFNQSDLERVRELESRMNIAFSILDRQVSVQSIFQALERTTLRTVQVTGFEYGKDTDNTLNLSLSLSTADFNSSLFQRDIFLSDSVLAGADVQEIGFTDQVLLEGESSSSETEVSYIVTKQFTASDIPYVPQQRNIVIPDQDLSSGPEEIVQEEGEVLPSEESTVSTEEDSAVTQDTNQ